MSEWEAYVCCTCFQEQRTSDPPVARGLLRVNRFGIVTLSTSEVPDDDSEAVCAWREGTSELMPGIQRACAHDDMRVVDMIFYWPGATAHAAHYPEVELLLSGGGLPHLEQAITKAEGRDYQSGGIWLKPDVAKLALAEVADLRKPMADFPNYEQNFVDRLELLLTASVRTGNPIITHYNGIVDGAW